MAYASHLPKPPQEFIIFNYKKLILIALAWAIYIANCKNLLVLGFMLHVCCMYVACMLHVRCMYVACTLHVHCRGTLSLCSSPW